MTQIRRGAFWLYRILLPVYVLGVLVAFVLAGQAVFERMNDFDAHQGAGFLTAMAGSLLLFLLALISWRDRATVGLTFLLAVLGVIVQSVLATFEHPWVGAFHPLNGVVILGLATHLMMRAWRGRLALPA